MESYNIEIYNGDTYDGVTFTITINGSPANLVGSSIKMHVREKREYDPVIELELDSGLTLVDAANGKFKIDEQIFSVVDPKSYKYDIEIIFSTGRKKTYIKGNFIIEEDQTYG